MLQIFFVDIKQNQRHFNEHKLCFHCEKLSAEDISLFVIT